jgi:hypothetical protein
MDIKSRSRHYSPQLRAEFLTLDAADAAYRAEGWRDNATHTHLGADWVAHSWAVAAWLQHIADCKTHPERYTQD